MILYLVLTIFSFSSGTAHRLDGFYPNHWELAMLANDVYREGPRTVPAGWDNVLNASTKWQQYGYFGAAYYHNASSTLIVAHRGTANWWDILQDIEIWRGKIVDQYNYTIGFVHEVVTTFPKWEIALSIGHSLGAHISELVTATYGINSVVFECPSASYVIDKYYPAVFKYNSTQLVDKVMIYNAAPNMITTWAGSQITAVRRVFSPLGWYDTYFFSCYDLFNSDTEIFLYGFNYTLQQHNLTLLIEQFDPTSGSLKIQSPLNNYWPSGEAEWRANFTLYDINPYNVEYCMTKDYSYDLGWGTTAYRILVVAYGTFGNRTQNVATPGIQLKGGNFPNTFFGSSNFADDILGGTQNDIYYPMGGNNLVSDLAGFDSYHIYLHNMYGRTTIQDLDGKGELFLFNYVCPLHQVFPVYNSNPPRYIFVPQKNACDLSKYSSASWQWPFVYIDHSADVLNITYNSQDLLITNDNPWQNDFPRQVLLKSFHWGDLNIVLNASQETLVQDGTNTKENITFCAPGVKENIIVGGERSNLFFLGQENVENCMIIARPHKGQNVYSFDPHFKVRFQSQPGTFPSSPFPSSFRKTTGRKIGETKLFEFYGMNKTDIIDFRPFPVVLTDLDITFKSNHTYISLPNHAIQLTLYYTSEFLLTSDGGKTFYQVNVNLTQTTEEQKAKTQIVVTRSNYSSSEFMWFDDLALLEEKAWEGKGLIILFGIVVALGGFIVSRMKWRSKKE